MGYWSSFAYLYIVGGIIFLIPIVLGFRTGAISMKSTLDRRIIVSLVAAYLIYFLVQGIWNFVAIQSAGS